MHFWLPTNLTIEVLRVSEAQEVFQIAWREKTTGINMFRATEVLTTENVVANQCHI